ncbi:GHKL domain-containing protein [Bacillus tamaricis]|uniref:GHKL domain-containing protein n=2 Tax=Evansella tamaricis TaxID=2069301 RepID=A0ABS6JAL8_9BACI|nr:GHKL domain-containing protein [Evansella tamaricis]
MELWETSIVTSNNDIFKEDIRENGYQMYLLVKKMLLGITCEENLKNLAHKVARERMEAGVNIGDFVYNVNRGRSIIVKYVIESGVPHKELQQIIENINEYFDQFCFYAVSRYTTLKDNEIQEKTSFIQQTHNDRLAVLGQLSSSFVHEFRNPLTSIIGFNKLLRKELTSHPYLDIIDQELDQLNFRITQFLHTSKADSKDKKVDEVDLHELLDDILRFLYPSIVEGDVNITTHFSTELKIHANKEELKQVFLNILFNSIDAVKQNKRNREIDVTCDKREGHIYITVKNNGPVIPKSVQETIFEPFFTTKEKGTGIGLYVCKKIVEKHGGDISCDSNNRETRFIIKLGTCMQ